MSDSVIDPATGLPELPEGYFWSIRNFEVCICKYDPIDWSIVTKKRYLDRLDLPYYVTRVEFNRKKGQLFKTRTYYTARAEPTESLVHDSSDAIISQHIEKFESVDKGNLISLCEGTLKSWNDYVEKAQIYGKYPPKKFEG